QTVAVTSARTVAVTSAHTVAAISARTVAAISAQTVAATSTRTTKSSSNDTIRIIITLDAPAADANVSITPLRYNKRFACSFTLDDGLVSAARVAFPFFNGGQVAPSFKDQWGFDQGGDGADHPGLFYTDGCGNPRPFTAAVAVNA